MKIKLTLEEIYALEAEISGMVDPSTRQPTLKGILSQELSLVTKFKISELRDELIPHKKNVDTLREELIKTLGKLDEKTGNATLEMLIDKLDAKGEVKTDVEGNPIKELNPKFQEFNDKMQELFIEVREIEVGEFKIEDFDFKTDEKYELFFKVLKKIKSSEQA